MKFLNRFIRHMFQRKLKGEIDLPVPSIPFWLIKERYDSVTINENNFIFLEIIINTQSVNICSEVLTKLSLGALSIHIAKVGQEEVNASIKKRIRQLEVQRIELLRKGMSDGDFLLKDITRLQQMQEQLSPYHSIPFTKCILMISSREERQVISLLSQISHVEMYPLYFEQVNGVKLILFHRSDHNGLNHLATNLHAINPFVLKDSLIHKGIFIGREKKTNVPVFTDFFAQENFNSVIVAKSGAGKSFLAKLLIRRMLLEGYRILVFDPEGEYEYLTVEYHGVSLSEKQLSGIDRILLDTNEVEYVKNLIPVIWMLDTAQHARLSEVSSVDEVISFCSSIDGYLSRIIQNMLHTKGRRREIVGKQFIHFHPLIDESSALMLYKIAAFALHSHEQPTILVIDEAHKVLDNPALARYIRQLVKRGRKYNLGCMIITQDLLDMIQNPWSKAILSNATHKFLLKQEVIALPLIEKIFGIHGYNTYLTDAAVGEGLFILGNAAKKVEFNDV